MKNKKQDDDDPSKLPAVAGQAVVSVKAAEAETVEEISLRPKVLDSFVGQAALKKGLGLMLAAARMRAEPLDHVLFYGPPGLGKTTLGGIIAGFHPPVLENGLHLALKDLADQLSNHPRALDTDITFNIPDSSTRYDQNIELHVFRIVQQACENAIQHGKPKTLAIGGALAENAIDLLIEDDGRGFETPDFAKLIASQHFGLAGMFERAGFTGAGLHLDSLLGSGTRIQLTWRGNGH